MNGTVEYKTSIYRYLGILEKVVSIIICDIESVTQECITRM